jgi:hypothetical protein
MREFNMLGEVDKMAAWSTAMNARLRDPLKLYEQKALAYDSEEGWSNFKTCLEGKRKKRLSRRRGLLSWIFEKDIQTAEEEISVDGDIVLMRSKGRSLLDAGSGDNSKYLLSWDSDEAATASPHQNKNLEAMTEDTWNCPPNQHRVTSDPLSASKLCPHRQKSLPPLFECPFRKSNLTIPGDERVASFSYLPNTF